MHPDQFTYGDLFNDGDRVTTDDVPIRDFRDNEAFGCSAYGFNLEKASFRQGHDLYTHIKDFTAWNVQRGMAVAYTAHYIFEGVDLVGVTPPPGSSQFWKGGGFGMEFGTNAADMVVINPKITDFTFGIILQNSITDHKGVGGGC